ncbi:glycosyltransferase [Helicobacter sp. WB40]|uniref:glycosyltransferase n=1 Tax=Helicobacter sp. WB40 TaxID=3004130 RepID=UPI0022EBFFBC|nr:glycosyltransferase [Helicobacter sp. WB40]MDA3967572.1 glycosyltransferase [Helicobacter sp. WB40]
MRNILILADLTSPLMKPRILMLKDLPYRKYILHNANNVALSEEILSSYEGFIVLEHPEIESLKLRYLYSFFYTLYLLVKLNPKLIVVHWASRLYQNLLLALFGKRVIVHTMGGEINKEEDCYGKKQFFTGILLKNAKVVTGKTQVMKDITLSNFPLLDEKKIKILSFGVEDRFCNIPSDDEKIELKIKLLGKNYKNIFFSIRTFKKIHFHKEIISAFLQNYKDDDNACLIVSVLSCESDYLQECEMEFDLKHQKNIKLINIKHEQMHEFLHISNAILSLKKFDGISQSIMESLCASVFVIASDIKNHAMLLKHKQNSYLINDFKELNDAFCFVLNNKFQNIDNGMLNRELQKKEYSRILKEEFNV